jgi:hypothetical protein
MIQARHFHGLLDYLAGRFFDEDGVLCMGEDFGIHLSLAAKEYFSIAIVSENLPEGKAVLGVLVDDSVHVPGRNGCTLFLYVDRENFAEPVLREILAAILLSHEICHFAYYYGLFLRLGDNTSSVLHGTFTHAVCGTLNGALTREKDSSSHTVLEDHGVVELLENFRRYPNSHFTRGTEEYTDYHRLIDDFNSHLHVKDMISTYLVAKKGRDKPEDD